MRPAHPQFRAATVPARPRCLSLSPRECVQRLRLLSLPLLAGYLFALLTVHATHTCHLSTSHSGIAAIPCCHETGGSLEKSCCNQIHLAEAACPPSTPILIAGVPCSGCMCLACLYLTEAMGDASIPVPALPVCLQCESLPHPRMPEPIRPSPAHPSSRDPPRVA